MGVLIHSNTMIIMLVDGKKAKVTMLMLIFVLFFFILVLK